MGRRQQPPLRRQSIAFNLAALKEELGISAQPTLPVGAEAHGRPASPQLSRPAAPAARPRVVVGRPLLHPGLMAELVDYYAQLPDLKFRPHTPTVIYASARLLATTFGQQYESVVSGRLHQMLASSVEAETAHDETIDVKIDRSRFTRWAGKMMVSFAISDPALQSGPPHFLAAERNAVLQGLALPGPVPSDRKPTVLSVGLLSARSRKMQDVLDAPYRPPLSLPTEAALGPVQVIHL